MAARPAAAKGLISAQRFPQDFDGIVAGAPVLNFVDTVAQSLLNGLVLVETPVPLAKMKLVSDAVYARCDAKDGLKDGVIDDPRRCDFDPARDVAQCPAGQDGEACLTQAQTAAIKKIYDGVQVDGKPAHFGQLVGAETPARSFTGRRHDRQRLGAVADPAGRRQGHPARLRRELRALLPAPSPIRPWIRRSSTSPRTSAKYADARALLNATDPNLGAVPRRAAASF